MKSEIASVEWGNDIRVLWPGIASPASVNQMENYER